MDLKDVDLKDVAIAQYGWDQSDTFVSLYITIPGKRVGRGQRQPDPNPNPITNPNANTHTHISLPGMRLAPLFFNKDLVQTEFPDNRTAVLRVIDLAGK